MTVANTIKDQLGFRALWMIGAKRLSGDEKSLTFAIGRNAKAVTHVRITLTPLDLYDVEFLWCRAGSDIKTRDREDGIYCDMLRAAISRGTGLVTSL